MTGRQPVALILEISSNLRGVPSGLAGIGEDVAGETDGAGDELGEFENREILAGADVDPVRRVGQA